MKITYDKITSEPSYPLRHAEVKILLNEVSEFVRKKIPHVRFENRLDVNAGEGWFEENVFLTSDLLRVASRGLTKEQCIRQVIRFFIKWSPYPWLDQRRLNSHPRKNDRPIPTTAFTQSETERITRTVLEKIAKLRDET